MSDRVYSLQPRTLLLVASVPSPRYSLAIFRGRRNFIVAHNRKSSLNAIKNAGRTATRRFLGTISDYGISELKDAPRLVSTHNKHGNSAPTAAAAAFRFRPRAYKRARNYNYIKVAYRARR